MGEVSGLKYKRALLKLSGESLMGKKSYGIESEALRQYALEIKKAVELGLQLGVVIGGGNIFRGLDADAVSIKERAQADYMGMMATVINGMALQSALEAEGVITRLQSAIKMEQIAEPFIRRRAIRHLEKGRVVIFAAGTGNPYFTTDTAAVLRAIEINAEVILKGTRVNGIYSADPEKDPNATRFETITFQEVYERELNVMDMTAITLCKENRLPLIVFNINKEDGFLQLMEGAKVGTEVVDRAPLGAVAN